jgi:heme-degrading monooxygenase HmoA
LAPARAEYRSLDPAMMTIITHVAVKEGSEPEWDAIMRERLDAARGRPGWLGGQLLIPLEALNERVIVGTWEMRADWEAWHEDEAFNETRQRLDGLQVEERESTWHEVLADLRATGAS